MGIFQHQSECDGSKLGEKSFSFLAVFTLLSAVMTLHTPDSVALFAESLSMGLFDLVKSADGDGRLFDVMR